MANHITISEAIKLLEKAGFTKRNQTGSHLSYVKEGKRITLVNSGRKSTTLGYRAIKQLKEILK